LIDACREQRAAVAHPEAPVFFAPRGGMGDLVAALVSDLDRRGVELVSGRAHALEGAGRRWHVTVDLGTADRGTTAGSARMHIAAEGVVVTTTAPTASTLLRVAAPRAATLLATVPYASVAMVCLAVPRDAIERPLDASGFLIPRVEARMVTACSWASSKWPHLAGDGTVWLRASAGRDGDDRALGLDDRALIAAVLADLRDTMALRGKPVDVRITRWLDSFPQYRPGHLDRVDAIEKDLAGNAPGLAVAGAGLRGLGVPACIRQATVAVARVLGR
jgi:oxygen-dependent protoporphyrinogen oxidase